MRNDQGGSITAAMIAVMVAAVLQILTPLLPQLGIGEPIGARSDAVRTLITPAGWAFSIWGALYAGSLAFAIWQLLPAQRGNRLLQRVRWPAAGAFFGNAIWAAHTQVYGLSAISVAIIAWTLVCLLVIYRAGSDVRLSAGERWFVYLPLSALTAWLTVATTVNIAASLRFHGVEGGAAAALIGATIVVVAGLIAAAALVRGRGNLPYAAVFLWALAAIYAAGGQVAGLIAAACAVAALLVVGGAFVGARRVR
ncbi:hypothetical protein [Sphingomonas dokdonensis]|uniref:TspO/MBR family protein n=1 Tax=Sphingomonas dokdonensis TaxID=344880 RepID=A0A245ZNP3_9SPHN|nr:hypothetical protein [Sphingomonas dokdonensis]OWK31353.1 hypothetical protein SPDO_13620 [Sphingomonas dokdonensis]